MVYRSNRAMPYRLKAMNFPARYWWMRSPNPWNANNARNVNTDGSLDNNNAYNGNGAVADCEKRSIKVGES